MDTIPIFECPLTQIKIRQCPVKTCAYNTGQDERNCLAVRDLIDDLDFSLQDVAQCRGLEPEVIKQLAQKGQRNIQRTMVLNDYLTWCDNKGWRDYPRLEGYHDPQLVAYVDQVLAVSAPFNIKELAWNIGKVCASVSSKWWKEYAKHRDLNFVSVSVSLGLPKRRVEEIANAFQQAHRRAITSAT